MNIVKISNANAYVNKMNTDNAKYKYDTLKKSITGLQNRESSQPWTYKNKEQTRNEYPIRSKKVKISDTSTATLYGMSVFDYNTDEEGKYFQKCGAVVGAITIEEALNRLNAAIGLTGEVEKSSQIIEYFRNKNTNYSSGTAEDEILDYSVRSNLQDKVLQYVINNHVYLDKNFVERYIRVCWDCGAFTDDELDQIEIVLGQFYSGYDFPHAVDELIFPSNWLEIYQAFIDFYKIKVEDLTQKQYMQIVYMPWQYFDDQDDFLHRGDGESLEAYLKKYKDKTRVRWWLILYPNDNPNFWSHSNAINRSEDWFEDHTFSNVRYYQAMDWNHIYRYGMTVDENGGYVFDSEPKDISRESLAGELWYETKSSSLTGPMQVWDNAQTGVGFHAQTELDLDPEARIPSTREEALSPRLVWPSWYASSLYIVNDEEFDTEHVVALPVSTLDPESDYLLNQTIAQEGRIYDSNHVNLTMIGNNAQDTQGGKDPTKPTDDIPSINPDDDDEGEIDDPILPSTSAINSGLVVCYNPSETGLRNVSTWLWDNDITKPEVWDKILSSPMDALISLKGLFCNIPDTVPSMFTLAGSITNINMQKLTKQFVELNCGSITIPKTFNSILDYNPYTKIEVFLPFIGFRQLDTDLCMGSTITIKYNIDLLSGDCVCNIRIARENMSVIMYNEHGNCSIDFPLTAKRDMRLLNLLGTSAAAFAGGSALGMATTAVNAAQTIGSKNNIQKVGNATMSAGAMSCKKPYIIIDKPQQAEATYFNDFYGFSNNQTVYLKNCSGFTKVKDIHLEGIIATENELKEIDRLLKEGVKI